MEQPTVIKIKPVFHEKLWGGRRLERFFKQEMPKGNIGECWLISAHPAGRTVVDGGLYDGQYLDDLFKKQRHLFKDNHNAEFPLIVKIIDAQQDLSIQVHPDNRYALSHGLTFGKEEAWIVLEPSNNGSIQLGHRALSKQQLLQWINEDEWNKILAYYPIRKNDIISVAPGTLHAILGGTMILEIQQSSDVTFRVYDYHRCDEYGKRRDLHLEQAMDV